jgi:hypothetical protein
MFVTKILLHFQTINQQKRARRLAISPYFMFATALVTIAI